MMQEIVWLAGAYLIGAVPFGLVIAWLGGAGDIRKIGSGNIGATNVMRTGRKGLALATVLLDGGKGAASVLAAQMMGAGDIAGWVGLAAVIGHCFPIYLSFKGGKGVATTIATLLVLSPLAGVALCLVWLASFAIFRISSLSALTGLAAALIWLWLMGDDNQILMPASLLIALSFARHHENIKRLIKGEEAAFKKKKETN